MFTDNKNFKKITGNLSSKILAKSDKGLAIK